MGQMKDRNVERLQAMAMPIQLSMPLTPWAQIVTPVLVARCDVRRVRPVATEFFRRWRTQQEFILMLSERPELFLLHVHGMLVPLGLAAVRTSAIVNLAKVLCELDTIKERSGVDLLTRETILAIPGCGRYVADSFDLFYRGNLDCDPVDPVLIAYRDEVRRRFETARARKVGPIAGALTIDVACSECEEDR